MTKKEIEKLLNERMKKNIEACRSRKPQIKRSSYLGHDVQLFAPLDGYELLRVNNKPSDLLFIKEQCKKDFCAFVVVTTWNNGETGFITFDFTEDKKEVCASDFIGATFSNWGKGCRKYAKDNNANIYAVFNSKLAKYQEAIKKHDERAKSAPRYDLTGRNDTNADGFRLWDLFNYSNKNISVSYYGKMNEANDQTFLKINGEELKTVYNGVKDLITKCFDKSGYFAELWRENLRQRAKEAKRQKAQEKAEKARQEWEKADKGEAKQNILFFAQYFQDLAQDFYKKVIKYKLGFTFYIKDRYSDILELYTSALLKAEKVGEKFRNFDEVNEYIEKCKKNAKKWDMLARFTLAGEQNARASYGWTWWELEKVGERFQLVNTYENGDDRFIKIKETKTGDYVGEYAEKVINR